MTLAIQTIMILGAVAVLVWLVGDVLPMPKLYRRTVQITWAAVTVTTTAYLLSKALLTA